MRRQLFNRCSSWLTGRWQGGIAVLVVILLLWLLPVLAQRSVTLNVLLPASDIPFLRQGLVADFEAAHPRIHLNLIEGPNATNLVEDLYTSAFILGESPYDLVFMDVIWTAKFAAAGWLLPLDDRTSASKLAAFLDKDIEAGYYQGQLYRLPLRSDVGVLYYRQDLLAAAGLEPPETFEELLDASAALQRQGAVDWGYLWQGRQYEGLMAVFVEVLAGYGGFWVDADTLAVGLDRPEALAAIAFLQESVGRGISPPGVTTYTEEETRFLFQSGKAAFLRSWPYVWQLAQAESSPVKGKIGLKAMVHGPGETAGACLGGWGLGIARGSKHADAAWQVIDYFTRPEVQRRFILDTGYISSRRELRDDPAIATKYSHYPQLLDIAENAVLRPAIAQYAQASDILQRYLSAALTGRMGGERAMQAAAAETRRILQVR